MLIEKKLYSSKEICKLFSISRAKVVNLRKKGLLNPIQLGGAVRFDHEELEKLIQYYKEGNK